MRTNSSRISLSLSLPTRKRSKQFAVFGVSFKRDALAQQQQRNQTVGENHAFGGRRRNRRRYSRGSLAKN